MLRGWLHHSSPSARSAYLLSSQQLRPRSMPPAHRPGSVFLLSWKRGVPLAPQAGRLHPVATNMPPTSWAQSLPRRRSCEGLGNGASHGNGGLSPSGTGASRREQFAALRAANGKARRTFVLRALLTPCHGVEPAQQSSKTDGGYLLPEPAPAGVGLGDLSGRRPRSCRSLKQVSDCETRESWKLQVES